MRAHVALQVEVGELVILLQLQQAGELGVRADDTSVGLVLETVSADVGVDLLGHLSAGHLSVLGLAEEGGKLSADAGGLDEPTWLAVAGGSTAALATGLLGLLELAVGALLKSTELVLDGGQGGAHLLDTTQQLGEVGGHGVDLLGDNVLGHLGLHLLGRLGSGGLGLLLGGLGGLCLSGRGLSVVLCSGHLIH